MDSLYYEESLEAMDYMPMQNNFLDIWKYKGATEPCIQEGVLDSENLDQYLSETPGANPDLPLVGGLRLIYSNIDEDADCSDKTVCWSQPDFVKIMESFRLPKRFTQMIGKCHSFVTQCVPNRLDAEAEWFSYVFSTMFHHCPLWFLAVTWDPESRTTYAFLHLSSDPDRDNMARLKRFLTENILQAIHPMLLPVLIMDLETTATLNDDEYWTSLMQEVESETRQRAGDSEVVNPFDLDLPSIIQRLNGCSYFLSLIERESEAVLLHLRQTRDAIADLQVKSPSFETETRTLTRHVDFLIESRKNLFLRLQNLQRRSHIQLAFTYNFLAQRDNKLNIEVARDSKLIALASSRDSMAMKTVAILTIAFLPGTFLSSLFAMPLFDWQASSKASIVGQYFWVYWGFAIPLTALVLGVWILWFRIKIKRHNRENNAVQARSFFGFVSEKKSDKESDA